MRSYHVKENLIGSAVTEIIEYKQTDRHTDRQTHILLLYYKDDKYACVQKKNMCYIIAKSTLFYAALFSGKKGKVHTHTKKGKQREKKVELKGQRVEKGGKGGGGGGLEIKNKIGQELKIWRLACEV